MNKQVHHRFMMFLPLYTIKNIITMRLLKFGIIFLICSQAYGQEWVKKASLPDDAPSRNHPVTFSIGEYGYLLTGGTDLGPENDFYQYNAQVNEWVTLPDFPGEKRGYSYGAAYDGKGYIGFGIGDDPLNDLWSYDPDQEIWKELAVCPCEPRLHPAFAVTNGKIYVGLGNNSSGNLNDFWAYDIISDTWQQLPDFPSYNRHHPFYFSIGKDVYVGMGHGSVEVDGWVVYKDFYKYDTESGSWTRLNDFPGEARVAGTQFTYNGKGYVLHGEGEDHQLLEDGEFWEYNPTNDMWEQLTSVPGGSRWAPGTFIVGDTVYTVAGSTTNYYDRKDMWSYHFEPISSTENLPKNTSISISPNPVIDCITLNIQTLMANANMPNQYEVWTTEGKLVHTGKAQSNIICLEFLNKGAYLLKLTNDRASQTLRFVKM
jgi:N-acetylneuraminic acid mutarotase